MSRCRKGDRARGPSPSVANRQDGIDIPACHKRDKRSNNPGTFDVTECESCRLARSRWSSR